MAAACAAMSFCFCCLRRRARPITPQQRRRASNSDTYRQLDLFGEVFERVRADYVETVTDEQLIEAAINGMLTALDPHSSYMNAKNFRDMQVQVQGEFGGLGIEVTMENGLVKVVSPIDDTPAAKAGLKPGDFITADRRRAGAGLSLNDAVEQDARPGRQRRSSSPSGARASDPFDVTLKRAVVKIQSVKSQLEGDDIGYIRITSFNEQADSGAQERDQGAEGQGRRQARRHRARPAQQSGRPARPGGRRLERLPRHRARSSRPAAAIPRTRSATTRRRRATSPTACRWWC